MNKEELVANLGTIARSGSKVSAHVQQSECQWWSLWRQMTLNVNVTELWLCVYINKVEFVL